MTCFLSNLLPVDSVSLSNPTTNADQSFVMSLEIFPSGQNHFNYSGISGIAFVFKNNQTLAPRRIYGPIIFSADPYYHFAEGNNSSNSRIIIGAAVGGSILLLLALLAGFYALRQKRRAKNAVEVNNPFGKIRSSSQQSDGQLVAIKRAKQASARGGLEFKTEIELLSRVHHKNVVGLMGFCFDQSEQMLVYEYIANGTLNESLSGKTGIRLDWMRRLQIALGAARGLQYLHELANPPIIHRDIKSNNILLDERLNAKVADFGLSKPGLSH